MDSLSCVIWGRIYKPIGPILCIACHLQRYFHLLKICTVIFMEDKHSKIVCFFEKRGFPLGLLTVGMSTRAINAKQLIPAFIALELIASRHHV